MPRRRVLMFQFGFVTVVGIVVISGWMPWFVTWHNDMPWENELSARAVLYAAGFVVGLPFALPIILFFRRMERWRKRERTWRRPGQAVERRPGQADSQS